MPIGEASLLERVRALLDERTGISEKKMVGGRGFGFAGTLCCGVNRQGLVVRVTAQTRDEVLSRPYVTPMTMGSKTTKGFVVVAAEGCASDEELTWWLEHAIGNAAEIAGVEKP